MDKNNNKGFTLIEMMIVIVIGSILLAAAVPSYRTIIQNNRAVSFTSDFVRAVHFTRSEAVKRSSPVAMCAAGSSALNSCGGAGNWTTGWLVFVDTAANGTYDAGTDTILATKESLYGQGTINAPSASLVYSGAGFLNAGSGMFTFAATGCQGKYARNIDIANSGRISIQEVNCP